MKSPPDPASVVADGKPRFRGRLHEVAFFLAVPAGVILIALANSFTARVAAAVYAGSLVGLYGASAAYHCHGWTPGARRRMKRLDHSMIFVLIAGTYTPLALLVLHPPWSTVLLIVVWGGAAAGIALKMVNIDGFRALSGTLYIALGWIVILQVPQLVHGLSNVALPLIMLGGLMYTLGAIVLHGHKPDPAPATFGYQEVWHAMVIAGSVCHYSAIMLVLLSVRGTIA
jgi:hemolysin III